MLNLYYDKIDNWQDICTVDDPDRPGHKRDHPFNFAMGLFMIHTGINRLTRKNAPEFYKRAKLCEACFGNLFTQGDGKPYYLTTDDVAKYIGLSSNASAYTEAQFFAHLRKDVARSLSETMERALREAERGQESAVSA
jgi:hypothetical protein